MNGHEIVNKWLVGTTCSRWSKKPIKSILFENNTHIILKHRAHSEYCGRATGTLNCESYAELYLKSDFEENGVPSSLTGFMGKRALIRWEGRLSKKKILSDCNHIGIIFDNDYNIVTKSIS